MYNPKRETGQNRDGPPVRSDYLSTSSNRKILAEHAYQSRDRCRQAGELPGQRRAAFCGVIVRGSISTARGQNLLTFPDFMSEIIVRFRPVRETPEGATQRTKPVGHSEGVCIAAADVVDTCALVPGIGVAHTVFPAISMPEQGNGAGV